MKIEIGKEFPQYFKALYPEEFGLFSHFETTTGIPMVPFTRETWNGRMKACRGVGAPLSQDELEEWEAEHRRLLEQIAPEKLEVKHYAAMLALKKK